mgnify:CR=1 FL=1
MKTITLKSIADLPSVAQTILEFSKMKFSLLRKNGEERIICFQGEMGAGKTTLIKEICKQLGMEDVSSSPTFSIVNEYKIPISDPKDFDSLTSKNNLDQKWHLLMNNIKVEYLNKSISKTYRNINFEQDFQQDQDEFKIEDNILSNLVLSKLRLYDSFSKFLFFINKK